MTTGDAIGIGTVLESRYEVVELLGEGGFGVVYKARQISTGQFVAIKLLHPAKLAGGRDAEAETARFKREMGLIGQLKHPNVVRLIDSGALDAGHLFTVLEYVEGQELGDLIAAEGALALRDAMRLMTQVLEALATAHSLGIVHRDLKPQNIMVTRSGSRRNAMVLDFGIATLVEDARGANYVTLTQTGQVHGTPIYMAPEQLEGRVSVQSDLYAWGLVFCEAVSGRRAIDADSVAGAIFQQLSPEPVRIPDAVDHARLREILARAVAKAPQARYPSADALLADLEGCLLVDSSTLVSLSTGSLAAGASTHAPHTGLADTLDPDDDLAILATSPVPQQSPRDGDGDDDDLRRTLVEQVPGATALVEGAQGAAQPRRSGRLWLALVALLVLALGAVTVWWLLGREPVTEEAAAGDTTCADGQAVTADTDGQCCYPGQAWNGERCVGVPQSCPAGHLVNSAAQTCSLPPCSAGMVRDGMHCCWAEQAWSEQQDRCIGTPRCPEQFLLDGEHCLALDDEAWLRATACEAGNLGDCVELARHLQDGRGVEHNPARALALLEKACRGDNAEGCHELGLVTLIGIGREADAEAGQALLEKACTGGRQAACFDLANQLLRRDEPEGAPRALALLRGACEASDLRACDALGSLLQHGGAGSTIALDLTEAARLYERACSGGYMFACTHLAWMLRDGLGVAEADEARAAKLLTAACDKGEALACANLAAMVERGRGVAADPQRASELRAQACRDGWYEACARR